VGITRRRVPRPLPELTVSTIVVLTVDRPSTAQFAGPTVLGSQPRICAANPFRNCGLGRDTVADA
jgi:hypothetical protein